MFSGLEDTKLVVYKQAAHLVLYPGSQTIHIVTEGDLS